jgi:DNA-binding NarL/FixJ family response regulator
MLALDPASTLAKRGSLADMLDKRSIQITLVDNSTYRMGLRALLDLHPGVSVLGETDSGREAISMIAELRPDLAVVDIELSDLNGIEVCRHLTAQVPETHVVLTSDYDWDALLAAAWDSGADAFLLRSTSSDALVRSILLAAAGQIYTPTQISRVRAWGRGIGGQLRTLSSREWVIFRQVAAGRTNREISADLNIAEHTVEKHLSALLQKFQVTSRTALLALILRHHLDHLAGLGQTAEIFPLPMAEIRHSGVTEIRHPEITEIRDDTRLTPL